MYHTNLLTKNQLIMPVTANCLTRKSWLEVPSGSDFPIQNIPFGVFLTKDNVVTVGTRIGNFAIDLGALQELNYFEGIELTNGLFTQNNSLNDFISCGKKTWRLVRNRIANIFDETNNILRDNLKHRSMIVFDINEVEMQMPVLISDYTDFYSCKQHIDNLKQILERGDNQLVENWLRLPASYNCRTSTIVSSGIPVHRPLFQSNSENKNKSFFGPSQAVDFKLETAFITTDINIIDKPVDVDEAEDYIFGMVLLNGWNSFDIENCRELGLNPFSFKNFASSISPWIITMDALELFKTKNMMQSASVCPYLQMEVEKSLDIVLEAFITPEGGSPTMLTQSNFKNTYWNISQQLTHYALNGSKINAGDMIGSGAISGTTPDSYGSMLELTWGGRTPLVLNDGSKRTFVEDYDIVTFKGYCENNQVRLGFGELTTKLLPPLAKKQYYKNRELEFNL